jgi:hypothetical protein
MNAASAILGLGGAVVSILALTGNKRSQPSAAALFSPPQPSTTRMLPAQASIPSHAVEVVTSAPRDAIEAPAVAQRGSRQAAQDLLSYVRPLISTGKADVLGSKTQPNDIVRIAQRDMKMKPSDQDGVYGPKTAARGKEILGTEFPSRTNKLAAAVMSRAAPKPAAPKQAPPAPAPAVQEYEQAPAVKAAAEATKPPAPPASLDTPVSEHSPKEAATALYTYVTSGHVDWGSKSKPNELIRGAQKDMGKLVADGIYGQKTRDRGKQLIGKTFPPRK